MDAQSHRLAIRFLLSLGTGAIVSSIAFSAAWVNMTFDWRLRSEQVKTQGLLRHIAEAIEAYRNKFGSPPAQLTEIRELKDIAFEFEFTDEGKLLDGWRRPYITSTPPMDRVTRSFPTAEMGGLEGRASTET